ncbi:Hsp20/alpha crystallin family protein [Desulfogranum mediterraneum]|uniref:Hsp20/alpha crystallin family protein n=1 Tax=Desulfogranum mediterraneum TaxID=160661 RepID=UPI0004111D4A|nr:Hsp20/alpha crystallin family protein [Desulfogranum mediterraneum]
MAKKEESTDLIRKEATHPAGPFEEMERYFDRFFRHPFALSPAVSWPGFDLAGMDGMSPSVDIFAEKDELVIKAEMPGIKKEEVQVSISDNTVTISGEKKQEEKVERKDYHRLERRYGSFCRRFRLPEEVNSEKAKASFKDGVLEIRLPKSKTGKQKKITIS